MPLIKMMVISIITMISKMVIIKIMTTMILMMTMVGGGIKGIVLRKQVASGFTGSWGSYPYENPLKYTS